MPTSRPASRCPASVDGPLVVEVADRALVAARVVGRLGRDRVGHRELDLVVAQVRLGDAARDAAAVAGVGIGDDVDGLDQAPRLEREQLGIARADADAVEAVPASVTRHSVSLASAFTAAAAIALPPRRPCTTRCSSAAGWRGELGLGLRRADEADGHADHGRRPVGARLDHLEQPEERGRRVADDDDRAGEPRPPQLHGGRACASCRARRRAAARPGARACRRPRCPRAGARG